MDSTAPTPDEGGRSQDNGLSARVAMLEMKHRRLELLLGQGNADGLRGELRQMNSALASLHVLQSELRDAVKDEQHVRRLQRTLDQELSGEWNETHADNVYRLRLWVLLQPFLLLAVAWIARCS